MSNTPVRRSGNALVIIGVLFFIFGFITWLNGTLIPFLKLACELRSDLLAFLVTSAFYMAYFFLAIPSSLILRRTGYKNGMALGLFVMALGSLLFVPAAHTRHFPLFLIGLFVQATGMALLQTASNPYISILGPLESAARRMSIMGICNKVAGISSPFIIGAIVLKGAAGLETQINTAADPAQKEALLSALAGRVVTPYLIIAGALLLLSVMIKMSSLPEIQVKEEEEITEASAATAKTSVFQYPHLLLGVLCIFFYVGVEVLVGDGIGTFGKALGISLDQTRYFTALPLTAMLVGYIIGIITIPRHISQSAALKICALSGFVFGAGVLVTTGYAAITFIVLLGLSNSLMWPAIWPLALEGLGRFTKLGSALLIMGIAGGAALPPLYGALKDSAHIQNNLAYCICVFPCYAYILYYAVRGHKAGRA